MKNNHSRFSIIKIIISVSSVKKTELGADITSLKISSRLLNQ